MEARDLSPGLEDELLTIIGSEGPIAAIKRSRPETGWSLRKCHCPCTAKTSPLWSRLVASGTRSGRFRMMCR